jgi:ubiquinone/menaquinone biosynthesis C-methylase UbiE
MPLGRKTPYYAGLQAEQFQAWEEEYRRKGRMWKGLSPPLPDLPPGSRVLELGCGNGKTLSAMVKRPWHIVALDISPVAVRLGKEIATSVSGASPNADFLVADASCLPFRDFYFDAVFAFHVVGHLLHEQRRQMALEVNRVLRPGGRLFFLGFERGDMRAGKGKEVEPYTFKRGEGILTHYFSGEEVVGLFDTLQPVLISTQSRKTRIMSTDHLRSEIEAVFLKEKLGRADRER